MDYSLLCHALRNKQLTMLVDLRLHRITPYLQPPYLNSCTKRSILAATGHRRDRFHYLWHALYDRDTEKVVSPGLQSVGLAHRLVESHWRSSSSPMYYKVTD